MKIDIKSEDFGKVISALMNEQNKAASASINPVVVDLDRLITELREQEEKPAVKQVKLMEKEV